MRSGDDLILHCDGEEQARKTVGDRTVNHLRLNIGIANAVVDDVRLYDYALTPEELATQERNTARTADALSADTADAPVLLSEADAPAFSTLSDPPLGHSPVPPSPPPSATTTSTACGWPNSATACGPGPTATTCTPPRW